MAGEQQPTPPTGDRLGEPGDRLVPPEGRVRGDDPADRYNHRAAAERDRERPTGHHDDPQIEAHGSTKPGDTHMDAEVLAEMTRRRDRSLED